MNIIVLPNQLFEDNKLINSKSVVYLYEHPIYFTKFQYHQLKLVLHRASMKYYQDFIKKKYKCQVIYIDYDQPLEIESSNTDQIEMYDPTDHLVMADLKKYINNDKLKLKIYETPLFLTTTEDLNRYLDEGGKYHQTSFYIWQRKRLQILVTEDNKPIGGKWTFDTKNRLPFPKDFKKDVKLPINKSKYVKEATTYVKAHFPNAYSSIDKETNTDNFYLPIDHKGAKKQLKDFLKERLACFGPYQDAVSKEIVFGCHSVLSPLINIGLITPEYVIEEIMKYADSHSQIPLESLEGLIRQIIGWREIIRLMYVFKREEMESINYFNHQRKIGKEWYNATTNVGPIDDLIRKVLKYSYAHHIERLMYLSNFMLLNQFHPDEIFKWFMTLFIDSYHWVMYANVYAMGQHSTGPLLMTRPYLSSSNYINKMSDYKTRKNEFSKIILKEEYEWYEVWDALYYNMIRNHQSKFSKNYAMASAVSHWKKKGKKEQNSLIKIAEQFLEMY